MVLNEIKHICSRGWPAFALALLHGVIFYYPQQAREVYRSIAQDIAWQAVTIKLLFLQAALVSTGPFALSLLFYLMVRHPMRHMPYLRYLSVAIACVPIASLALGILAAKTPPPTAVTDSRVMRTLSEITGENLNSPIIKDMSQQLLDFNDRLDQMALCCLALALIVSVIIVTAIRFAEATNIRPNVKQSIVFAILLSIFGAWIVLFFPQDITMAAGSVPSISVFFAGTSLLAAAFFVIQDQTGFPLGVFLFFYLLFSINLSRGTPIITDDLNAKASKFEGNPKPLYTASAALVDWFNNRPDRALFAGRKYPIYIVAAQGGGIYAAYHAASFLSSIRDHCPSFATHLFAISGVSGGSIGSSSYGSAIVHAPAQDASQLNCGRPQSPAYWNGEYSSMRYVDKLLTQDMLTPLLHGFLFRDAAAYLMPFSNRSHRTNNLERALELAETVAAQKYGKRSDSFFFSSPYNTHWSPSGDVPALLMNTTEVETGGRAILSPFLFSGDALRFLSIPELKVSTGAVLSARFPYVTAPAIYSGPNIQLADNSEDTNGVVRRLLVDGGYAENSGALTAMDLIAALGQSSIRNSIAVRLIILTLSGYASQTFASVEEAFIPIFTLYTSRAARTVSAIKQAQRQINRGIDRVYLVELQQLGYKLPLGWQLSDVTSLLIESQNGRQQSCSAEPKQSFDADCVLADIQQDLSAADERRK